MGVRLSTVAKYVDAVAVESQQSRHVVRTHFWQRSVDALIVGFVWAQVVGSMREVTLIVHPDLNDECAAVFGQDVDWPTFVTSNIDAMPNSSVIHKVHVLAGAHAPPDEFVSELVDSLSIQCDVCVVGYDILDSLRIEVVDDALQTDDWFVPLSIDARVRGCVAAGVGIPHRTSLHRAVAKVVKALDDGTP